jgi:flagellin
LQAISTDASAKTIIVQINNAGATTAANVATAINALAEFTATVGAAGAIDGTGCDVGITATTDADRLSITAAVAGSDYNDVTVNIVADSTPTGTPTAAYNVTTRVLQININDAGTTTLANIQTAGPQVVSNQQARLGINSVNTGKLGGSAGRLYELGSGGAKSLVNNSTGAATVVEQVINKVASLRGRLGAFQRTTLETNIRSLSDTLATLIEAESSIRDADFAKESARLTRAQILVQSGMQVLSIANQNPQNVLALLR